MSEERKLKALPGFTYGQTVVFIIRKMIEDMHRPQVRQMREQNKMSFLIMMKNKYSELRDTSPTLFEKVIEDHPNFDLKRLMTMMGVSDKVSSNEMTYEEASKYIGKKYYEEFIEPNIDLPPAEPTITEVMEDDNDEMDDEESE